MRINIRNKQLFFETNCMNMSVADNLKFFKCLMKKKSKIRCFISNVKNSTHFMGSYL